MLQARVVGLCRGCMTVAREETAGVVPHQGQTWSFAGEGKLGQERGAHAGLGGESCPAPA